MLLLKLICEILRLPQSIPLPKDPPVSGCTVTDLHRTCTCFLEWDFLSKLSHLLYSFLPEKSINLYFLYRANLLFTSCVVLFSAGTGLFPLSCSCTEPNNLQVRVSSQELPSVPSLRAYRYGCPSQIPILCRTKYLTGTGV